MVLNPLIGAVRHELSSYEFTAVVCVEHSELAAALPLPGCLVALDGVRNCYRGIGQHGPCKENGPLAHLLWILVFDDQNNQIGLMNFASVYFVVQYGARRDLDEGDVMIR